MEEAWVEEFDEKFVYTFDVSAGVYRVFNIDNGEYATLSEMKRFISQKLEEARQKEHRKTWDNIKEIYDTTDYKKHIEEAEKEVAIKCKKIGQRIIRNSDDWRSFADEIDKEFGLRINDTSTN